MIFIRAAFDLFKSMIRSGGGIKAFSGAGSVKDGDSLRLSRAIGGGDSSDASEQIKKLKMQVQQRDNEINILVSMLQRREGGGRPAGGGAAVSALKGPLPTASGSPGVLNQSLASNRPSGQASSMTDQGPGAASGSDSGRHDGGAGADSLASSVDDIATLMNTNLLGDRNKAFELFRKSYRQNEVNVLQHILDNHSC